VGEFGVENRHHFRNLNELEVRWKFTEDDIELNAGKLNLDLPAGQAEVINIPYKKPELKPGAIYQVLISFHTREDRSWAAAGHEVAWEQFRLPFFRPSVPEKVSGKRLELSAEDDVLMISGEGFTYSFDKSAGTLVSMVVNGREMLSKGPRLNVWRAPLANDLDSWNFWHTDMGYVQDWMGRETANGWRSLGLDRLKQTVDHISIVPDGNVVIHVEASLHANNYTTGFKVFYQYTFTAGGEIELSTRVSPRGYMSRWIPKIGIQLELYPAFRNLEWFGRGPFETYPDRKTGAKIGKYHTTVDEDFVPYIIPQDYGNKTDVYWAKVSDDSGRGIFISGDDTFNTSLQKYSTEALDRAFYPFQLPSDSEVVTLNLDHRVSGVGCTAMSVLNPYRVLPGEAAFTFHIRPLIQ
jgi:beta-galactosidase